MPDDQRPETAVIVGPSDGDLFALEGLSNPPHIVISERTAKSLTHRDRYASVLVVPSGSGMRSYETSEEQILEHVRRIRDSLPSANHLRVIAAREHTLRIAASIREALKIPGESPEVIELFRNKAALDARLRGSEIRLPKSIYLEEGFPTDTLKNWATSTSATRFIVKPVDEASSTGVLDVQREALVRAAIEQSETWGRILIQEFIDLPIGHIDGVVQDGRISEIYIGQYWRTTLQYQRDKLPMGSIDVTAELGSAALKLANNLFEVTGLRNSAFHIEVFIDGNKLILLEAAARPGGINIPDHLSAVHEFPIRRRHIDAQMGRYSKKMPSMPITQPQNCTGWLLIPQTNRDLIRVVDCSLERGRWQILQERVPPPGSTLSPAPSGLTAIARYVLKFDTSSKVEALLLLQQAANGWKMAFEEIG